MIASSSSSPPMRIDWDTTIPPSEITATSLVPPPMSTTMFPVGSPTGRPAPIAAAVAGEVGEKAHVTRVIQEIKPHTGSLLRLRQPQEILHERGAPKPRRSVAQIQASSCAVFSFDRGFLRVNTSA